ncbi:MAG: TrkH family potassium uptake protein [Clostridioides sp.]|jgi:trk system potassium uptake protein TrkH|nr:TrkH family potassium uptake protein [Clostridioides sp.]
MNKFMIRYILGVALAIEGLFMLLPLIVGIVYGESDWIWFLVVSLGAIAVGATMSSVHKSKTKHMFAKEGFLVVALSWVVLGLVGALPFYLSGAIPNYINALFESISGLTTTGATVIADIESLSHGMLFWRSLTIWIGGMGILVFMMAILPLAGGEQNMHLLRAESPGPMVNKLMPRLSSTVKMLYILYILLSILQFLLLICGGMEAFDAINITFSTAGTGGFAVTNSSMGEYDSYYLRNVVSVFMVLFGTNFTVFFLLYAKKFKEILHLEELRWYIVILLSTTVMVALNINHIYGSFYSSLNYAFFQVSSLMTSTGLYTVNYDLWPEFSRTMLIIVMCIGACAGSTAGGFKISRLIILSKYALKSFQRVLHPRNIRSIKMDGKIIGSTTVHDTSSYLSIYIGLFFVSVIIVSLNGFDFFTNFSAVAATFNNAGVGFNMAGPTQNYAKFTVISKLVFMVDMLAGRLEIYPILFLFAPTFWKKL